MKTMKRILALLIVLVMTASMLPLSAFANPDITFYTDSVTVAAGSKFKLSCDNYSDPTTFVSDNDDLVYISSSEARVMGEGTANITVTDADGDTAVLKVVAVPVDDIAVPVTSETTITVNSEETGNSGIAVFKFTAPEAGTYAIYSRNISRDTYVYYYDSEMNYLGYDDDDGGNSNFRIQVELAEGETIYVNSQFWRNFVSETNYYDVIFEKLIPAESISLQNVASAYYVGDTRNASVVFSPENGIVEEYSFATSDESVATVSSGGYIRFLAEGNVTITVTSESGLTDSVDITVTERPALEGIEITGIDDETPYVGDYDILYYDRVPGDAAATNAIWSSNNESVATVSSTGYVEFIAAGTATITITVDGGFSDSVTYTVSERPALESLEIYSVETTKPYVGDYDYLYYNSYPADAIVDEVWSSDNEEVATVSESGYVEFVGEGTVTITLTSGEISDSVTFTVSVRPALERIEIVSIDDTTPYVGDADWIYCNIYPEDAIVGGITWTSDNESVATVDEDGDVAFIGAGTVTITATSGEISDSVTYTVSERPALESIEIYNVDTTTPYVGNNDYLSCRYNPQDAYEVITWSSGNEEIATVDWSGMVSFIAEGTVTITATSENGLTDSVTFTVSRRPVLESLEIYSVYTETPYVDDYDDLYYDGNPTDALVGTVTWTSDNEEVATVSANGRVHFISAGTVTITVANGDGISGSVTFTVIERPKAESIEILYGDSVDLYVGSYMRILVDYTPDEADPNYSFSSDNESVATVDEHGYIDVYSVGIATITVTAEHGVSDTIVVNGIAPIVPELNKEYYFDDNTYGIGVFEFVPEESGIYAFYSYNNDYDTYGYLFDGDKNDITSNDDYDDYNNFRIDYELTAGETYYFIAAPYNEDRGMEKRGYSVKLIKTVPAESISFEKDSYDVYAGSEFLLSVVVAPDNASIPSYEFSTDNPDVMEVYSDGWIEVYPDAEPCTVTVTVTTEEGLSATTVINIIEPKAIKLNEKVKFTVDEYIYNRYTFTPEESGEYYVWLDYGDIYEIEIDGGNIYESVYSGEYVNFEKGVTYYLTVYTDDEYAGRSFNFGIYEDIYKNVELINASEMEYVLAVGLFVYDNEDGSFSVMPRDLTGIKLKVTNHDGTVEYLTDADVDVIMRTLGGVQYDIDNIYPEAPGTYESTLYFAGYEFPVTVTLVENNVTNVELVKGPDLNKYADGFLPRFDGIQLLVTYADGTEETITLTENMIKYDAIYDVVMGTVKLEGIDIVIMAQSGSPLMMKAVNNGYNGELICNGFIIDLSEAITRNEDIYVVDYTVTQFNGVDGMDIVVEFSDGSKVPLTLEVFENTVYADGEEGYAMTEMGIVYYGYYSNIVTGKQYIYIFDVQVEIPDTAMFLEGDVNDDGKLTAVDYLMMKRIVFSMVALDDLKTPETALSRCDLNGDSKVTAVDYLRLKRMIFTA